jgi:protocatechuate 3,4-dioxygenase beta subunit
VSTRRRATIAASLLVGLLWLPAAATAQRQTPCRERVPASSSVRTAPPDEPGERMLVVGQVLVGKDRGTISGARVLAFHTDARGYYSEGGMDENNARLCGVLKTSDDGGFRFDMIRPAHYATGGPPAHVHFEVTLPNGQVERFSLEFEGDPLLGGKPAGERWDNIRPVTRDEDGLLIVERDLWVREVHGPRPPARPTQRSSASRP